MFPKPGFSVVCCISQENAISCFLLFWVLLGSQCSSLNPCKPTKTRPWSHLHFAKETQETAQETGQDMNTAEDRQNSNKLELFFQYLCSSLNMINVYLCLQFHIRGTCYRFLKAQKHHPAEEAPEFKRAGIGIALVEVT